ncbi:MAG: UDP-2,3-diacylglucosamine diphosphatase LpxI [Phycisphaeraceae bacterium]
MEAERPIGLIAGSGRLPVLEAAGLRAAGRRVVCVAIGDGHDPDLPTLCDQYAKAGILRLGRWARLLRRWGAEQAVMVGAVRKARMYDPFTALKQVPDWRAFRLWYRVLRHDRRSQVLLAALADELQSQGIELIDTTRYIPEHLATVGVMTRTPPSAAQMADIAFGWPILMRMNDLDIGQAIAVKGKDVIAVEAIEGTDGMIRRAGELCRSGGWVLLKGPKPDKDRRFDVPTVGVQTIESLKAAGGACLAVAAGSVILAEKGRVIAAADAAGIAIVGVETETLINGNDRP